MGALTKSCDSSIKLRNRQVRIPNEGRHSPGYLMIKSVELRTFAAGTGAKVGKSCANKYRCRRQWQR